MPDRRTIATLLLAAGLLAACGEPTVRPGAERTATSPGPAEPVFGAEEIGFGEALAQIRGHQLVALELFEAGDEEAALVHAAHPIEEVLDSLRSELQEHGGSAAVGLEESLEAYRAAVEAGEPAAQVAAAADATEEAVRDAETSVIGAEVTGTPAYRGSVIAALLGTAAHEYEESLANGRISLVEEYQDGYGFVQVARHDYEILAPDIEADEPEEAEEIEEAFGTLESAFPGPIPPAQTADVESVEAAADLIGHELEETVDAVPLEEADPEEVVSEIETLLGEVIVAYEAGQSEEAAELVAEAYLENYEVIEAEVIEQAPEVNEELEPLLGAELRRRIMEGAPASEIRSMIERARTLLGEALLAVSGGDA